tara:strand:+ start:3607 stop:3909 length:303 start_codon:yes stop_codon:yes gene_type:complete
MNFYKKIIISCVALSNIISCRKNECLDGVKARVENNQIDGCGYTIRLDNGDQIEPVNLSDFNLDLEHNKKVWVIYHVNQNLSASICMVGDIVVIDCISER